MEKDAWTLEMNEQNSLDLQYAIFKAQVQEYGHPRNRVLRRMRYEVALATDPNASY